MSNVTYVTGRMNKQTNQTNTFPPWFSRIHSHFRRVLKISKIFVISLCLSVCPHEATRLILWRIFMKSIIFRKSAKKIQALLKSDKNNWYCTWRLMWAGQLSRYSDWLRAGRSGDRIPVGARFFAPVQTGPGAHPASCTMGTGSFPGVKSGRDVTLTPHTPF